MERSENAGAAQEPLLILGKEGHNIKDMAYSPDGSKIVTGGEDHNVRIWDVETGSFCGRWRGMREMSDL